MRKGIRAHRPLIMGRNGAVGSNHPLATQAGLDVLRAGGNAADAAVAISMTLGVVEPMMSGLGGDGFYHIHLPGQNAAFVYNGTGFAPAAATPDAFANGIEVLGPRSVSVPGLLGGLDALHTAHGVLPWPKLFTAAITHARDGFAATHNYRYFAGECRAALVKDARSREVLLHQAEVPELAALIAQPDLARTLQEIAADGAESFYRGRLAKRLAASLQEMGALITEADLAGFHAERQAPISVRYRGFELRQTPPNSTGFVMLEIMKIAERFDLANVAPDALVHILVEAKKRAFLDRERHGADPRFGDIPLDMLLSDKHADELAASIDMERAAEIPLVEEKAEGDTTYFCVIDHDGNVVSAIQSINNAFGSGLIAGDTGILLNNRMAYWHLAEGHANRLQPGKRVRHTMNAPMVFRDGTFWGVLGTPGADNQVQVNAQVLVGMADFGLDPQAALEAPRWTSTQPGQGANWPHDGDGSLTIEEGYAPEVYDGLARRGHRLNRVAPLEGPCSVQAIRMMENGVRMAGSDPRRDGWAAAY
jgi:gamma-glutamyltranspeptidase